MKASLYIENGVTRLFLGPETDEDRNIISAISLEKHVVNVYRGGFKQTLGGWDSVSTIEDGLVFRMSKNGERNGTDAKSAVV